MFARLQGSPSEVLPDVTCDVRAAVTQAGGGRRLVDEASQKCVKATDICQCASQSENAGHWIWGLEWNANSAYILLCPSWMQAGGCSCVWQMVELPAFWFLCVTFMPVQWLSLWDNPDHSFSCVYVEGFHVHQAIRNNNTLVKLCVRAFWTHLWSAVINIILMSPRHSWCV